MRRAILEAVPHAPIRVGVVWTNMLAEDNENAARRSANNCFILTPGRPVEGGTRADPARFYSGDRLTAALAQMCGVILHP